ncbi:MAG: hypothetical protein V1664_04655 [Candidatus Uhrbacteria bacterium]
MKSEAWSQIISETVGRLWKTKEPLKTEVLPSREEESSREKLLQKEFAGAVLKWIKKLEVELEKRKPKMSTSRRLGSIFGPVVLFTTVVGCGDLKKLIVQQVNQN